MEMHDYNVKSCSNAHMLRSYKYKTVFCYGSLKKHCIFLTFLTNVHHFKTQLKR